RLLGGTTFWDEVDGPSHTPAQPKAQVELLMVDALTADGTPGNGAPTAVVRTSFNTPPPGWGAPKVRDYVWDFSPTTAQYLMWKFTTPLGYKAGELIELVARFSMADNVTSGNIRVITGIAPMVDGTTNLGYW